MSLEYSRDIDDEGYKGINDRYGSKQSPINTHITVHWWDIEYKINTFSDTCSKATINYRVCHCVF